MRDPELTSVLQRLLLLLPASCVSSEQDVYDKVEYLSSLGKTQTAAVQRDADIGVAEAERDAGIRVKGPLRENEIICSLIRHSCLSISPPFLTGS